MATWLMLPCSGIINVAELGVWAWAVYTGILSAIVAVTVIKDRCANALRQPVLSLLLDFWQAPLALALA